MGTARGEVEGFAVGPLLRVDVILPMVSLVRVNDGEDVDFSGLEAGDGEESMIVGDSLKGVGYSLKGRIFEGWNDGMGDELGKGVENVVTIVVVSVGSCDG